jgi:hypothetical protein
MALIRQKVTRPPKRKLELKDAYSNVREETVHEAPLGEAGTITVQAQGLLIPSPPPVGRTSAKELIHRSAEKKNSRKFAVTSSPAPPRPYTNRDGVEPHLALYLAPNCYVYC